MGHFPGRKHSRSPQIMFSLKRQAKGDGSSSRGEKRRQVPGEIRIQKDISELDLDGWASVAFPNKNDLLKFTVTINPKEGLYRNGGFPFEFIIPSAYPHEAPKIYHPNIDLQGNVCLNILREEWKPVLSINAIIYGLQFLFLEPNPDDPLNREAAQCMRENRRLFDQNVARSMRGGLVNGHYFERTLA